jgi:hypothetical protein
MATIAIVLSRLSGTEVELEFLKTGALFCATGLIVLISAAYLSGGSKKSGPRK